MIFKPSEPDVNYFRKWVSETGAWELGYTQMLFGVRVRLGRTGWGCCELDLCAGANPEYQEAILRAVMLILLPVPEDVHPAEISKLFPRFRVKPIFNDRENYQRLMDSAEKQLYSR